MLDDFDDSARGPALVDIVRFLGSIDLAARQRGWTRDRDALVALASAVGAASTNSRVLRTPDAGFLRIVRVRFLPQVEADAHLPPFGEIQRMPQRAGRGLAAVERPGQHHVHRLVRFSDDVLGQLASLGGDPFREHGVAPADSSGLLGGRRILAIQVLMQPEVRADERPARALDDVLTIVGVRVLPHERLTMAVGDQVMARLEHVVLLGEEEGLLGFLDAGAGVQEQPKHLTLVQPDAAVFCAVSRVLGFEFVVGL